MQTSDHAANAWGRSFLWGGTVLGALLLAALLTGGFGLLRGGKNAQSEAPMMVRRGEQIIVPESSPLRKRLEVTAALADSLEASAYLVKPVELEELAAAISRRMAES